MSDRTKGIIAILLILFLLGFLIGLVEFNTKCTHSQCDACVNDSIKTIEHPMVVIDGYSYYKQGGNLAPTPETLKRCTSITVQLDDLVEIQKAMEE